MICKVLLYLFLIQCYKGIAPGVGVNTVKGDIQGCFRTLAHQIGLIHIDGLGDSGVCQRIATAGIKNLIQGVCTDDGGKDHNLAGCFIAPFTGNGDHIFHQLLRRKEKILNFQRNLGGGIFPGGLVQSIFYIASCCGILHALFHQQYIPEIKRLI